MSLTYKLHYKIYHYFSQQFQTLSLKIFFNTKKFQNVIFCSKIQFFILKHNIVSSDRFFVFLIYL